MEGSEDQGRKGKMRPLVMEGSEYQGRKRKNITAQETQ